jgi:hypothetical protein
MFSMTTQLRGTTGVQQTRHLIVVLHGLLGTPSQMDALVASFRRTAPLDTAFIVPSLTAFSNIEEGGRAIADAVEEFYRREVGFNTIKPLRISFVGHSLGGIQARYAIGELELRGAFSLYLVCDTYISIATPHIGVNANSTTIQLVAATLGTMARRNNIFQQLTFGDDPPLLVTISDPNGPFLRGLALFRQRVLYANIAYDAHVGYESAAILATNPYNSMMMGDAESDEFESIDSPILRPSTITHIHPEWDTAFLRYTEHQPDLPIYNLRDTPHLVFQPTDPDNAFEAVAYRHPKRHRSMTYVYKNLRASCEWRLHDVYIVRPILAHSAILNDPAVVKHCTTTLFGEDSS